MEQKGSTVIVLKKFLDDIIENFLNDSAKKLK